MRPIRYNAKICLAASFAVFMALGNAYSQLPARYPPILILSLDKGYGNFTGELLKTEGLHAYRIEPLTKAMTLDHLQKFNVVVMTAGDMSGEQRQLLSAYVREGGNLIAFRPDKGLSRVFGIRDQADSIGESYVRIDSSGGIAKGITSQTLQFHGMADKYLTVTATRIAALCKDAHTVTAYPAVVANRYGKGHAIAFLYNLPLSIAATRQGNYRNAGREMDGIVGIRAMDLFTDGWVDTSKNTLNQADEQMRLFTRCIEWMVGFREPLPRFWYFPDTLKCLVTLNNDGEDNKEDEFEQQFKDIAAKGAKMTLYIKELDSVSKKWTDAWSARGFEIAGHYNDTKQAVNPDWRTMDSVYKNLNGKLKNIYGIQRILTVVNHWFVWCGTDETGRRDFSAQARIEELNGIRLDCNYAHYDNGSPQGHFLGPLGTRQGNYTGSGLPMKFADLQGNVIDIYQQLNNVYDQQYMEHNDKEGFYDCFKGLMDRSLEDEVYSFVCIKAHNAEYFFSKEPLMHMLDYANSKGVPVWTELELLDFEKARDEAAFTGLHWVRDKLTFTIKSSVAAAHDITCMIPHRYMGKRVDKVTQNGVSRSWLIKKVKGAEYAWLTIRPGTDYKVEVRYK
ncbi:MAG: hypothetical protein J0H74_14085 [Chitinophagaceae bacterium]|nr:hypothetical protein [Chitinophagaceae bacterium]